MTISQDKAMAKFEVKVVGHPKPEIKWLKAGEEIVPSDEFQIENLEDGTSVLVINDVYPDDTGIIKCEAYNSVGVAETVTEFIVEGTKKTGLHSFTFLFSEYLNSQDLQLCSPSYTLIFISVINVYSTFCFSPEMLFAVSNIFIVF